MKEKVYSESELLRMIMENSKDWQMFLSPEGGIQYISPGATEITGYSVNEFMKDAGLVEEIIYGEDLRIYELLKYESSSSGSQAQKDIRIICKSGDVRWTNQYRKPVYSGEGNLIGTVVVIKDITSIKEDLEKLSLFSEIVEQSTEAVTVMDSAGNIEYCNYALMEITGFTLSELKKIRVFDYIHNPETEKQFPGLGSVLIDGTVWRGQNRFRKKDGTCYYLDSVVFPLKNNAGKITNYVKISRDITDLKRFEEELRESEAKNKAILNLQPDLIFILDKEQRFSDYFVNDVEALAFSPREFLGKKVQDIFSEDMASKFNKYYTKAFATGEMTQFEYELLLKERVQYYEARIIPFGEDKIMAIVRNMTEKREQEQELLKLKKLESVGVLAGGIAHDFNNVLAGAVGNIELASMELDPGHPAFGYLERANKGLLRASSLTKQLLTFAKGGDPVIGVHDVKEILRESVLFNLTGSSVKPVFSLAGDLWMVKADKGQIEQVFGNLTLNAKQAMPDGGKLYISASNLSGLPPALNNENTSTGKYIKIVFKDEGKGIPPEYLDTVFDPYFSTKKEGTGLGLATVFSIIKKHGGSIKADSCPGGGAVFTLCLPAEVFGDEEYSDLNRKEESSLEGLKILVMDDEEYIRKVLTSMLSLLGILVDTAENGNETFDLYRKSVEQGTPYAAVIMDLTIPGGMGGKETLERLLPLDPDIKAVVTSGYSNDPVMANYKDYGFSGCLIKPFTLDSLQRMLVSLFKGDP
ncbi:MAG: hypothetical protein DRP59_12340 [Spirochaetes bacterium]|nr:MAG: hypothetical protein DRP59_12340 [Spirochaetota bacterium]